MWKNRSRLGVLLLIIILLGGTVNLLTFLKILNPMDIYYNKKLIPISGGKLYLSGFFWSFNLNTTEEDWKIQEILSLINHSEKSTPILYVLSNNPVITYPLRYRTLIKGYNLEIIKPDTNQLIFLLFSADYILYTTSEFFSAPWKVRYSNQARYLFNLYNNVTDNFVPIKQFEFPDGNIGVLYKRLNKEPHALNISTNDIHVVCKKENINFDNKIRFLGICIYQFEKLQSDFMIEYYWEATTKVEQDYTIFVHFTDEEGNMVFQQDHKPCSGKCPTSTWKPGQVVTEAYLFQTPRPGCYQIRLGFWNPSTRERLSVEEKYNDGHNRAVVGELCHTVINDIR